MIQQELIYLFIKNRLNYYRNGRIQQAYALHHDEYEKEKEMVEEIPQGRPENTHKHKHSHHTKCIGIRQCVACDLMSPLRDFSTSLHKFYRVLYYTYS